MPKVVGVCAACGNELVEGYEVILLRGDDVYFCDEVCLCEYLFKTGDIKVVVLGQE